MPGRFRLRRLITIWPDVTELLAEWTQAIERACSWSWGPGFDVHVGDAGTTVNLNLPPGGKIAKAGPSGIAAMSGTTPGVGEITLYSLAGSGNPLEEGEPDIAYNIGLGASPDGPVAADAWVIVMRVDSEWLVVWEQCS